MKLPDICAYMAISLSIGQSIAVPTLAQSGAHPANQSQAQQAAAQIGANNSQPNAQPSNGVVPAAGATGAGTAPNALPINAVIQQPATSRAAATEQARIGAGRNNPFSGIEGEYQPFPSQNSRAVLGNAGSKNLPKRADVPPFVPPPPPSAVGSFPSGGHGAMVPPPPPEGVLDPKELPLPPEKPSIGAKLKLVGIIGDRALFIFTDPLMREQHKWPHNISLGVGEMFENVSVVNVTPDSVTLEEDGDRSVRELPRIR